jgi:prepilin-type processing-associated H-X9-DG protein
MARRIAVVFGGLLAFALAGLFIPYLIKMRARADVVTCQNNLREIVMFAAHHAKPRPGVAPGRFVNEVPAGTIPLPGVPPEERLSWVVAVLPGLDQRRHNTEQLLVTIDRNSPWPADRNQQAARTKLVTFLCPGNPPAIATDQPAPACYVGIGGLGKDAAATADPARAGCFRYDGPTPFDRITDGLGTTLLLGERSGDLGPWLRGGPATVRGLDDAPGAPPVLGPGGQFGGNHPSGANWAMADGSVRLFSPRVDPKVLYGLATIAGGERDPLPGE